ncbi:TRAP transporter large permease subunit [Suttonella sp. R2A3]|uniref:Na+/H+ antiporter family protein n=1 Tax=Suttonella sp. R2A3 TaxID=2908648 RepID=UPI001F33C496|nr:Na+/H+ antiporter NhaC family protein [Suttonella sp. R2A3]UJF23926.1 TRAP transporter large permease subunit [Suttonella sp. R2A3]
MNAIVLAVLLMVGLSVARVSVVFALIVAAVAGGLYAGMPIEEIVEAFNNGLGDGATMALAYAALGAFAVILARTGITQKLADILLKRIDGSSKRLGLMVLIYGGLIIAGIFSQTLIPVHIAFIPILIPPLLHVLNRLQLDRRAVACAITFAITTTYFTLPVGFGSIFLNDVLIGQINSSGMDVDRSIAAPAMLVPAAGMVCGLLFALFLSYRKPRQYAEQAISGERKAQNSALKPWQIAMIVLAILLALGAQLYTGSMIFGGVVGFACVAATGVIRWHEQNDVFLQGMHLMAMVGFIMIAATGFASVMKASGEIPALVEASLAIIGDNRAFAALIMLVIGLFITMGIGSSFSTVPIIATIYVPLCLQFGFSPMATVALVGSAAALGDAGSPASDSTLGPTSGLNADGQHDHIRDTVIPTFLHFNIPLIFSGWIGAMVL